ncbi:glycosyltransferase family 4 protein [Rhodoferax sp.]|uniref:glycosyltransferase family 4 protein n=1 Tax=Rhodoferax sp. TaxID=50421 RepID=UPI0026282D77|nr:glycosyltransferase family 4 protein [Rhodoferax sp.]MDD2808212.1 glycosyltransferase family 4 protein [Rhodoferax sp.]MDD4941995.1 glycosyltransferase family 4 protein [Rhodoferax sp.]MDD5480363.1 glycosyltransferase family 4 protein [Rhodoferax sp.]
MTLQPAPRTRPAYALWAPEMATPGGVQSYMWRLWEVLTSMQGAETTLPVGLSLLDSTAQLAAWPNPTQPRPVGANGSRLNFVRMALGACRAQCVVVGHLNQAPVALLAMLLGRIDRYVVVLHGIEAWHQQTFWRRLAMRYAHTVVATTHYTLQTCAAANSLPTSNFKVIPLCAEPNPAKPDPHFKLDGAFPILFVGRLAKSEQYKGLETLMQAVASLVGNHIPAKLHVVGDGDDRARLQALGRTIGLSTEHIQFHGRVSDAVLQAAYASAQVFAMPSAKEGFGIVFLEAMRHGVVCIGGAHGGTLEVFQDQIEGLLVRYGDVDNLLHGLESLLKNASLHHRLSTASQNRFESDYIFPVFSNRWAQRLNRTS